MNIFRWHVPGSIALLLPLLALGGCYTQFGSSSDESTLDYASSEEGAAGGVSDGDYYTAREKFYADAYYPGYIWGMGMGIGAYEWGWGYPYAPYASGHVYGGGHGVSGNPGITLRPRGATRGFGSERTLGTGRMEASPMAPAPAGYVPLPVGVRQAGSSPSSGGTAARPGYTGGRRGTEERRVAPVTKPATIYIPPPPSRGGSSGSGRSTDRPAERSAPPPAPPAQSAPAPAPSAPSGGSRGNDSRGSRP